MIGVGKLDIHLYETLASVLSSCAISPPEPLSHHSAASPAELLSSTSDCTVRQLVAPCIKVGATRLLSETTGLSLWLAKDTFYPYHSRPADVCTGSHPGQERVRSLSPLQVRSVMLARLLHRYCADDELPSSLYCASTLQVFGRHFLYSSHTFIASYLALILLATLLYTNYLKRKVAPRRTLVSTAPIVSSWPLTSPNMLVRCSF